MSKGTNKGAVLLDLAGRNRARPFEVEVIPDAALAKELADRAGAKSVKDIRLIGQVVAEGRHGWKLSAHLSGQAEQSCVVSDVPVWTTIGHDITRIYRDDLPEPGPGEAEMPEDTDLEPMPERLNLIDVMAEEIALNLPDYPRAENVPYVETQAAQDIEEPSEKENPFSVLKTLRLKGDDGEGQG